MGPSRQPFEYTCRRSPHRASCVVPAGSSDRHDEHVSETPRSPEPLHGELDLSAFAVPYDAAAAAASQTALWPTVPTGKPVLDGQLWVDWMMGIAGVLATLIFLPVWVSMMVGVLSLDSRAAWARAVGNIPVLLIMSGLLATFVVWAIWGLFRARRGRSRGHLWWRLERFAAQNGLTYRPWAQVTGSTTSLVRDSTRFWFEDRFQLAEAPNDLTIATLVTGGTTANFNVGERRWGFIELQLDRSLPHIVVETTERGRAISDYGMRAEQGFELEGDFPRYARVYADDPDRRTALELLTPDVMAAIADETAGFDLEVRGDRLSISSPVASELANPATLVRLFRMAAVIGEEARAVATRRGDARHLVALSDGTTPERMPQRRIPRGAVRGFVIAGILIGGSTLAAIVAILINGA